MTISPLLASDDALPLQLRELLNSPDGAAFEQALDVMVRQREQHLFRAMGQLARDLHSAVRRLGGELSQDGMPEMVADARQHLQEALELSSDAAHRSIDFAERMVPQADALASQAAEVMRHGDGGEAAASLARQVVDFTTGCRNGLSDMILAQSWQDLTGQRIKKVGNFIGTVESSMLELVRLTGALAGSEVPLSVERVTSQEDADRLLSEFGF
ncbi:MAG: protein phosphatase CheZ [Pseudomonadota bacterium]|nr:protein phosphatase CheZ [Xanthomonadaceae bacterium]MDE2247676.1 protein phosphatase CheZ [Xanthomonadaceae bacterium]MDE3211490.1 protein phosphatase CheZ [Pseudomonadota bacterium]